MQHRVPAVLCLFFLSPLIAEYLLGSLPIAMLGALPLMAMLYGSGAVIIRELVRQTGRGWPTQILLATAYGFFEEGLVTQSLFNPNYLNLRLLDYGFIPTLGTGAPWLIYVIGLHVIWSVSAPIALTEALFVRQRDAPWLGKIGVGVFVVLMLAGASLTAFFTYNQSPFMASPVQLAATAAIIVALVAAAFLPPKRKEARVGKAPHFAVVFLVTFVCGSAFVGAELLGPALHWPWAATTTAQIGALLVALAFAIIFTRNREWSVLQRFALTAGLLAVYMWFGFVVLGSLHADDPPAAHVVLVAAFVALCGLAAAQASSSRSAKGSVLLSKNRS